MFHSMEHPLFLFSEAAAKALSENARNFRIISIRLIIIEPKNKRGPYDGVSRQPYLLNGSQNVIRLHRIIQGNILGNFQWGAMAAASIRIKKGCFNAKQPF